MHKRFQLNPTNPVSQRRQKKLITRDQVCRDGPDPGEI